MPYINGVLYSLEVQLVPPEVQYQGFKNFK